MSSVPLFLYPSDLRDAPAETMSRNRGKCSGSLAERKPEIPLSLMRNHNSS